MIWWNAFFFSVCQNGLSLDNCIPFRHGSGTQHGRLALDAKFAQEIVIAGITVRLH
eukprot:COSAG02_NODE_33020_length_507_cov_0.448529_1_plen_55_part_10